MRRTPAGRKTAAVRTSNEVARGFAAAIAQLKRLKRQYALVGAFAVNVRTEPRFTADVDFVVSVNDDAEAEQVALALQRAGWVIRMLIEQKANKRLGTVRFQVPDLDPDLRIDLLFAATGLEPEVVAGATQERVASGEIVPTASVAHLIALKCLSESSRRPTDRTDLVNLIAVASPADLAEARRAVRVITRRGYARRKNLLRVLDRFVRLAKDRKS